MDKVTLVRSDIDVGALILDALSRTKMPITFCDWHYVEQLAEWQLVIATPWYDEKGPRTTYRAVVDALTKAGVYDDAPMRRIFVMSPTNPIVQDLERVAKTKNEGFIHILRHRGSRGEEFSVLFAPVAGPGGPVQAKHFLGNEPLRAFLVGRLNLRESAIKDAILELTNNGHASIYPVQLTTREIKKLGLS